MRLGDSHCHLQDSAFDDDRSEVLRRSLDTLDFVVVIGDDVATSRRGMDLVGDGVFATVGVHPYDAADVDAGVLDELRAMCAASGVVGIGEIGLDYYKYNETPRPVQERAFRLQLELAIKEELPVVIHNRESGDDLCRVLAEYENDLCGGVIHCFAGDECFLDRCLKMGFYISFAGNVTFPKAEELRTAAKRVPLHRLMVETDSPYLAPQAVRGKRCEPWHVAYTAEVLAEVKGLPVDVLAEIATENAATLFRL